MVDRLVETQTGGDYDDSVVTKGASYHTRHPLREEVPSRNRLSYKQGIWNRFVQLYIRDLIYHCPYYGLAAEFPAGRYPDDQCTECPVSTYLKESAAEYYRGIPADLEVWIVYNGVR